MADALQAALKGCPPALIRDALTDAEEHLRNEMIQHPAMNEREVLIETTPKGEELRSEAGCLAERLVETSGAPVAGIIDLNKRVKDFRDRVYAGL